jgi:hypothetical protein
MHPITATTKRDTEIYLTSVECSLVLKRIYFGVHMLAKAEVCMRGALIPRLLYTFIERGLGPGRTFTLHSSKLKCFIFNQ